MFENFEEEYKKDLLLKIKENINNYNQDLKNNGYIEYASRSPRHNSIVGIIGTIWGIIIFSIIAFVFYKEALLPMAINISLTKYLLIIAFLFVSLLLGIFYSTKNTKRVNKFILNNDCITINFFKGKSQIENKYNINNLNFFVRYRRKETATNLRHGTFNINITYNNKKNKFILHAEDETKFFVFLLFLESKFNNININEITDEKLYEMYHSKYYDLKYNN